jgi:hypothetical protein
MKLPALLIAGGIGLAALAPAEAKDTRPKSDNPNVKRAMKKAKKVRPNSKYKAPKKAKAKTHKPPAAKYGVKHV